MHVQLAELPTIDRCDVGHGSVRGSLLAAGGGGSGGSGGQRAVGVLEGPVSCRCSLKLWSRFEPKSNTAVLLR